MVRSYLEFSNAVWSAFVRVNVFIKKVSLIEVLKKWQKKEKLQESETRNNEPHDTAQPQPIIISN